MKAASRCKETSLNRDIHSEPEPGLEDPEPLIPDQEEEQVEDGQEPDSPTDVLEVTQTREMKRKGIKLPKGWKIYGVKRQSEISNNGESYQYFRYRQIVHYCSNSFMHLKVSQTK